MDGSQCSAQSQLVGRRQATLLYAAEFHQAFCSSSCYGFQDASRPQFCNTTPPPPAPPPPPTPTPTSTPTAAADDDDYYHHQ